MHANSPADVPARVEALCTTAGLSREATHSQLAAGLHAVVHVGRGGDGVRLIASVGVVVRRPDGLVDVVPALEQVAGTTVTAAGRVRLEQRLDRQLGTVP
jgi:pilus assembly protein CpaF